MFGFLWSTLFARMYVTVSVKEFDVFPAYYGTDTSNIYIYIVRMYVEVNQIESCIYKSPFDHLEKY